MNTYDMDYSSDEGSGFGVFDGVVVWVWPPSNGHEDWAWTASKYDGEYASGVPRKVSGIGSIEGRASSEEEALNLAKEAAHLIGMNPSNLWPVAPEPKAEPDPKESEAPKIEVRFVGGIEIPADNSRGYRATHGYAIFVDGVEQGPWLQLHHAIETAEGLRRSVGGDA